MENQAQAPTQSGSRKEPSTDPVKAQGILNEVCRKQKFAAKLWHERWGFYTQTKKLEEEEALKLGPGMSAEEYRAAVRVLSTVPKPANQFRPHVEASPKPIPTTSAGMYGHRASCTLEKYGRLVQTPRCVPTRPPLPPGQVYDPYKQTMVFLGSVSGDPISYKLPPARCEVTDEMWARPQDCPAAPLRLTKRPSSTRSLDNNTPS